MKNNYKSLFKWLKFLSSVIPLKIIGTNKLHVVLEIKVVLMEIKELFLKLRSFDYILLFCIYGTLLLYYSQDSEDANMLSLFQR